MIVNTLLLVKALGKVLPSLPKRTPLADMKQFYFSGTYVTTFNDQISIRYPFKTAFQCTVPADELYDIVSKISEVETNLSYENNVFTIQTDTVTSKIKVPEGSRLGEMMEKSINLDNLLWKRVPGDFLEGLSLCEFSTSRDMTHGRLTCVAINEDCIMSSDDLRISLYRMSAPTALKMVLIPVTSIRQLLNYPVTAVSHRNTWIHFRGKEGEIFSCRVLEESFPEVKPFMVLEGEEIELPKNSSSLIDIVLPFTQNVSEIDKKIQITLQKNVFILRAEREAGWIEKKVSISYDGEPFSFSGNPIFLKQILEKSTTFVVNTEQERALFTTDNFKHLMALPSN